MGSKIYLEIGTLAEAEAYARDKIGEGFTIEVVKFSVVGVYKGKKVRMFDRGPIDYNDVCCGCNRHIRDHFGDNYRCDAVELPTERP